MSVKVLFSLSIVLIFLLGCVSAPPEDVSPRDLEIRINNGKAATASADVQLSLFARHAADCRISNDGSSWGPWESYSIDKSWTLDGADGLKQVFYQCRNSAGELSSTVSESIELDSTHPTISLSSPESGKTYYNSVELAFNVSDPASDTVKCSATIGNTVQELGILHTDKPQSVLISLSTGEKSLSLTCSDGVHSTSKNISFTMKKKPVVTVRINGGSDYTESKNVTLDLSSATATECRFSRGQTQWSNWEPYTGSAAWILKGNDGNKRAYAQCRDSNGIESEIAEDTIILDTQPPPYISLSINNHAAWTFSQDVALGLYAYSAKECRFSNDGQSWSAWEAYSTKKTWKLTDGEGEKTVHYECRNKSGGDLGIVSTKINYSTIPPTSPSALSIQINNGEEYTSSENMQLSLSAAGAFECRLREGSLDWSAWENFVDAKTFKITGNDGAKTIYYQCRNSHGSTTVFDRIYLDRGAPSQVKSLKAAASPYSVVLSWGAASDSGSGIESYSVFRKVDSAWKWIGSVSGLSFKDEGVVSGESYEYRVGALDYNRNAGSFSEVNVQVPVEGESGILRVSGEPS